MATQPLQFLRRGELVSLNHVPPDRTLLQVLREDLNCTGTKEGCGEGDCGACTVVLGEMEGNKIRYRAINSCIRLAHSVQGMAVWTVEDLAQGDQLHPVQEALVQCHASQCGFCTPGFVMSLFGMYQNHVCQGRPITRELAAVELSGNLCRCTGYRPILDAAQRMGHLPRVQVDEAHLRVKLAQLALSPRAQSHYHAPPTLAELLKVRAELPSAQLVAGCTDVGLWITKQHKRFDTVIDITRCAELRQVEEYPHHMAIGAAVTLTQAFAALIKHRPQLQYFSHRFSGLPVRNAGTLGGNVANGSPIGDAMPLLIALGANIVLMSQHGYRELPLENLYTGYRQNVMVQDEILAWIKIPHPSANEQLKAYKISKRFDDDISAVCLCINVHIEQGMVQHAAIGVGGVAATPVRAIQTETTLQGHTWNAGTVQQAISTLRDEFSPISDMRASSAYRRQVLGNLLQRFWLESQGDEQINLAEMDNQGLKV